MPHQQEDPNIIPLIGDAQLFDQEVRRRIPPGTDIQRARDVMTKSGFGSVILVNGTMKPGMTFDKVRHQRKTELFCAKSTRFIVFNSWIVYFSFQNGRVTGSTASFRSTASDL